jgi:hypothetical protein
MDRRPGGVLARLWHAGLGGAVAGLHAVAVITGSTWAGWEARGAGLEPATTSSKGWRSTS